MGKTTRLRLWALWTAYAIMVGGFALATYKLDKRMSDIEDDICFAIITDLGVDLLDPNLDASDRETLGDLIIKIKSDCDD